MQDKGIIQQKSLRFAIRIVKLTQYLQLEKKEYILSKQLMRSGTSIGANVTEAEYSISQKEFNMKMYIAYKECGETAYWLRLLYETKYLSQQQYDSIRPDCIEIQKNFNSYYEDDEKKGRRRNIIIKFRRYIIFSAAPPFLTSNFSFLILDGTEFDYV